MITDTIDEWKIAYNNADPGEIGEMIGCLERVLDKNTFIKSPNT